MKKDASLQNWLNMTDKEFDEYVRSTNYFENHWNLYTHIISTTIHSVSLIESLLNDFITYFYCISKNVQVDFVDTILNKITLRDKYKIFMKLISKMLVEDTNKLIDKFDKISLLIRL